MPDILETFRQKAADLTSAINRAGGIRATIDSLRRQMAEADRRREMTKAKTELARMNQQIGEMITAIGVQAVGLHQAGKLTAIELQPLCQHVVELKAAVAQQEAELSKMEAAASAEAPSPSPACPSCGRPVTGEGSFCPYCGAALPQHRMFCAYCGSGLRPQAKFCAQCGQTVQSTNAQPNT